MSSPSSLATTITVATNLTELQPFLPGLEELATHAIEPNVFYEPWMLVPAMTWLAPADGLRLVLIHRTAGVVGRQPVLVGFFPVEVRALYNHFPVRTVRLWKHRLCYLCTPLLREGYAPEALEAFLGWAESDGSDGRLLEFGQVPGEGPVHDLVVEWLWTSARPSLVDTRWTRPCLTRAQNADVYLDLAMSKRHQKDIEKKEKKLCQTGNVEYANPESTADACRWIEEFLAMEARGWRGQRKLACVNDPRSSEFFREAMNEGWRVGRLDMIGLRVDRRLIAIKVNLRCSGGAFAYMTTYDENSSSCSPGLLLEIENLRRFHQQESALWMDSCADQNSPLFTRVWTGKRTIETLLISAGNRIGDFWVGAIPFGHFLRRVLVPPTGQQAGP